ncbi:MAG: molecular chaperone DnaJ, partial [Mycobacterium sp.]|nr:molecular chaperone DnaJ [Mycobacterium sp.]
MGNARVARDYYGTLGVERDAGPDEIKRAYRKLARELHPDVNPDAAAQERFAEVSAAYEVLSDPEKRRVVDLGGDPLGNGGGGGGGAGDPFGGAFGFGDIMDAFFGGQGG